MVIVPRRDITRVLATVLRPGCFESRKISLHNIGLWNAKTSYKRGMSTVDEDIVLGKEGSLNMLAKSIRGKIYRSQIAMNGGVENADGPY